MYTASVKQGFDTYTISPLGGEPTLMLANAGGMTWLDARRILFSEIKTGFHMGIVAADEDRSNNRELYFPQHKRLMAHYSYPSPDWRWALLVEMDYRPVWEQCRIIPLDGSSPGHFVGPAGPCSSAGWSPDGRWMYFTVEIGRESHLWRQAFPDGRPEQLTFGPAQEEGLAVAPDGLIITSIGTAQGALWIHDSQGDHQLSTEGDVVGRIGSYSMPVFSLDGSRLTYLRRESPASAPELWTTDLATGRSELRLPAVGMDEYDISPDGKQIVFTIRPRQHAIGVVDWPDGPQHRTETNRRGRRGCPVLRRIRRNPVPFHDRDRQLPRAHGTRRIGTTQGRRLPDRNSAVDFSRPPMADCDHTGTGRRAHCVDGDSDEWRSAAADLPRRVRQRLVTRRQIVLRPDSAIPAARPDGHSFRERRDRPA